MIHPILSLKAHYQTFVLKHFQPSRYGRYMKKIHNSHLDETCFVIGNGPSLTADDLTILSKHNIDTFAVNRIFRIFTETPWRPTYYVNTDYVMIRDILEDVNRIPVRDKFTSLQNKFYHGIEIKGAHHFLCSFDKDAEIKLDCTDYLKDMGTVTIACIQLAIHMGYRKIYLLGVDHNFDKYITETGEVVIDPSVKNYFCEGYDDDVANEVVHDLGVTTKAYMKVREFCDKNSIEIKNATRTTKLTAFECVDFDLLVGEQESE